MATRWLLELAAFLIAAAWLAWLRWTAWIRSRRPAPGPAGDPYASEVAEFRRQVSDWSRGG